MKPANNPRLTAAELRARAEVAFQTKATSTVANSIAPMPEEVRAQLHELQIHEIELEMQNDELNHAQDELATAHARYLDLYDFAPVGYCTINEKGVITEANLTLAALLGVTRLSLTKRLFSHYIQHKDQDDFYRLRRKMLAASTVAVIHSDPFTITPAACEVRLVKSDGADYWARLIVTPVADEQGEKAMRIAVIDITERQQLEQQLHEFQQTEHRKTRAALVTSEECFRSIVEVQPECVKIVDAKGCLVQMNPAGLAMIEADNLQQVQGLNVAGLVVASQREAYRAFEAGVLAGKSAAMEFEIIGLRGTPLWIDSHAVPLPGQPDSPPKMLAITRDITARKQADEEIRRLNTQLKQFKNTLDQTLDSVFMFDLESLRFTYVNQGAMLQVGYSETELLQMTAVDIKPLFTLEQFRQMLQPLVDGVLPSLTIESVHRHKDGHDIPVEIFLQLVRQEGQGQGQSQPPSFVAIVSDISERLTTQKQIDLLANHDVLTGLPNRMLTKDHLQQAILVAERENSKVALLFIDLDNFKIINDSLGHVIGDELLKSVATRLRECLRDVDTLSRQGGDEFLIVLNNVGDTASITVVAEKILARMLEPFEIDQHELSSSLSIGIAVYPDDGKDFVTLLKQADTAMYQAKESGRNTHRFHTDQMNIDAVEHLRIRNGLRRALEQGEFVLHYQPQINLATGAVFGAEALIRWHHPELGMLPPGRFISIAEDSGLIVPIGDWVLQEACRQAVAWCKAGLPELLIAVNLSVVQFRHGDVLKSVTQALAESGLEPALLELELTESILIKDAEKVLATVRQLKSLGVKLSIDDFGTGYSSLSYLKRFDVDKLKIDQSFVRDMVDDAHDAVIVGTIIQMAKSLGLTTIAEGVEDERQLAMLRLAHCDEAQGYYFAHPMPADEFESFILNGEITIHPTV
jgi:diguanylate cyclase (GGDEF)-like protein/PAS domain S-box-containing protein